MPLLTLAAAKQALGIDAAVADHDARLAQLIAAAEATAEKLSWVAGALRDETFTFRRPRAGELRLELRPVAAVLSVSYLDSAGVPIPWADKRAASLNGLTRITPMPGACWPRTADAPDAWTVIATVGHASAATAPPDWLQAVTAMVVHWFDNPGAIGEGSALPIGPEKMLKLLRRAGL